MNLTNGEKRKSKSHRETHIVEDNTLNWGRHVFYEVITNGRRRTKKKKVEMWKKQSSRVFILDIFIYLYIHVNNNILSWETTWWCGLRRPAAGFPSLFAVRRFPSMSQCTAWFHAGLTIPQVASAHRPWVSRACAAGLLRPTLAQRSTLFPGTTAVGLRTI